MRHASKYGGLIVGLVTVNFALLAATPEAAAISYVFTDIADNRSGQFVNFPPGIDINNSGAVAFKGRMPEGPAPLPTQGIFVGSGGPLTIIADNRGPSPFGGSPFSGFQGDLTISINEAGAVPFGAFLRAGGGGIFRGDGGPLTTITDSTNPDLVGGENPLINDSGTVAFKGFRSGGGQGIFVGDGGPVLEIVASPFASIASEFSFNNNGSVVFHWFVGALGDPFVLYQNGILSFLNAPSPYRIVGTPTLNDNDVVAFRANTSDDRWAIFTAHDGHVIQIVDTAGPFALLGDPSINNLGQLVFDAYLDDGTRGMFTGPDPINDKVIQVGDSLFGSTVEFIAFFGPEALNDRGQIAFLALLSDGSEAIVRASPVSVPAAVILVATGLVALIAVGRMLPTTAGNRDVA